MKCNDIILLKFKVPYNRYGIKLFIKDVSYIKYRKIYSCVVKNYFLNNSKKEWQVSIRIMSNEQFNTLDIDEVIDFIVDKFIQDLSDNDIKPFLCYKQPSLKIMDEAFYPYVYSLALKQQQHWPVYEVDDLIQMCRKCMLDLYNKGYYIHRALLDKAFINSIYYDMRKRKYDSCVVSLREFDDTFNESYIDSLEDKKFNDNRRDAEDLSVISSIFDEIKPIIIDTIGERRYQLLLKDITNKCVTQTDQSMIRRIRLALNKQNKNKDWFNKKLIGDK